MTMLDRMRRHKNWLKWSLAIVVVAFVWLYIPDFMRNQANGASNDAIATVDGRDITVAKFRRIYQQQMQMYRQAYGGKFDERLLRQIGIDQRIIQQLIEEEAALSEAGRQGITASDAEVSARIVSLPAFQENGAFIGHDRYAQMLRMQNPPVRPSDFEEEIRRSIQVEKLRSAITDWISISDADVDAEFAKRNEKVKLAVVSFPADKFREGATATDAELQAHFDANKETYRVPEKRKVKYALIDLQAIRERTKIAPEDIQRFYEDNQQQYSTQEQVRASHILLKTEGKDEAAVRKEAEALLAKLKGGADFAQLATKMSEDVQSAKQGGDLGFFNRGDMVKEFEDAAFGMKPGELSGVVKTVHGFHIIKVTEKHEASTRTLDQVRVQIEDQLKWDRAQKEGDRIASDLAGKLTKPADLDTVARSRGLTVGESAFFARDEPISGMGMAPAASERAFELKEGEVSDAIRTPTGITFISVTGKQDARVPSMEEVKARVREDVVKKKAIDLARQKASTIVGQLRSGDFTAGAKAAGLEAKTTDLVARGAAIPDIGVSPAVDAAAFTLDVNGVSDPIVTDNGAVIVKVLEKKTPTPDEVKAGHETLKAEMLNQQRGRFYASYMSKARDRMNIKTNAQVLAQLLGGQ
jgi:peptidyl-prolyl cis-trans isomerase D